MARINVYNAAWMIMWFVSWHVERRLNKREKNLDASLSTKNSENFGTGVNDSELFPRKVSRISEMCCSSVELFTQPNILESPERKFWPNFNFWFTWRGSPKIPEILFYSSHGIPEISNHCFCSDVKRPLKKAPYNFAQTPRKVKK